MTVGAEVSSRIYPGGGVEACLLHSLGDIIACVGGIVDG